LIIDYCLLIIGERKDTSYEEAKNQSKIRGITAFAGVNFSPQKRGTETNSNDQNRKLEIEN